MICAPVPSQQMSRPVHGPAPELEVGVAVELLPPVGVVQPAPGPPPTAPHLPTLAEEPLRGNSD